MDIHDERAWAEQAVQMFDEFSAVQQRNLMMPLFSTVARVEAEGDKAAAVALCRDLAAAIDLRQDPVLREVLDRDSAVDREGPSPSTRQSRPSGVGDPPFRRKSRTHGGSGAEGRIRTARHSPTAYTGDL